MIKKGAKYYQENADKLGWSEDKVKLDDERVGLLKKYVIGETVLDVGCGSGIYVDLLSKIGKDATGVDLVPLFIERAKQTKQGNYLAGSAERLPFSKKSFETVILFDILEHGDDLEILREAIRVVKKRILVIVPREIDQQLGDSGVIFRHYLDKSHLREYTKDLIADLAAKTGLKVIRMQTVHPLNNKIIFLALYQGPIWWRDVLRKLVSFVLPYREYPTELFAVLDIE